MTKYLTLKNSESFKEYITYLIRRLFKTWFYTFGISALLLLPTIIVIYSIYYSVNLSVSIENCKPLELYDFLGVCLTLGHTITAIHFMIIGIKQVFNKNK